MSVGECHLIMYQGIAHRASLRLVPSTLPPLARLSQTAVRVLSRFRKLLHLTSTARAERLPSLCRIRSFLNFTGDRRLELGARVRAAVCSDTLLRHSGAFAVVTALPRRATGRPIKVLKMVPSEPAYIVLTFLYEFKPNHQSQKSDKHKMLHVCQLHVVTITKQEAAN